MFFISFESKPYQDRTLDFLNMFHMFIDHCTQLLKNMIKVTKVHVQKKEP